LASGDKELIKKLESLSPEAKEKAAEYIDMLKTLEEVKTSEPVIDFKEKA